MVWEPGRVRVERGRCGCGGVTFAADLQRSPSASACPCDDCAASGWRGLRLGDDGVELLTGWELLERRPGVVPLLHCARCGTAVFAEGAAGLEANARCVPFATELPLQRVHHLA